jgi:hypothetical protein
VTTYKVSIVILGTEHGGAIVNLPDMPVVGQRVTVGELEVEILEVVELLPPRGEFHFLHATCRPTTPDITSGSEKG